MASRAQPASAPSIPRTPGVLLVDRLPVVRAGLRLLIDAQSDMEVVADVGTAAEALEAIAARRGRLIVLVGLSLDGPEDAGWLVKALRELHPTHTVVAMGANADPAAISRILFLGADGYIDKNVDTDRFLVSLEKASEGGTPVATPASLDVGSIATTLDRRRELEVALTERERQVLEVAAEGLTAKEIAHRLGVRERTITTHLARIYGKLGVRNRFAALRLASRSGLVSLGALE